MYWVWFEFNNAFSVATFPRRAMALSFYDNLCTALSGSQVQYLVKFWCNTERCQIFTNKEALCHLTK